MIGEQMYHTVLTLRKCGVSQREIASEVNLSKTTVKKYCTMTEYAVVKEFMRDRLARKPKIRERAEGC